MALGKTVGELLEEVGASELTEWMAFAELEPFGCVVDDLRAVLAPAVTVNMNRDRETKPVPPLIFFPWHQPKPEPEPPDTPEERARRLRELLDAKSKT